MAAIIKNESRQPVVLILDHPAFANKADGWVRSTAHFAAQSEDGRRSVKEVRRAYPGSLTLLPGESSAPMHEAVVRCAQFPGLLSKKVVSVSYQADPVPESVSSRLHPEELVVEATEETPRSRKRLASEG